ncbi:IMPACT family protein [Nocardioidaceae bacterium]|nr:IMPACT family protein [Nocardioidaceae bacterium]
MRLSAYAVPARSAEAEVTDRGSRFLAFVERVKDEDAARAVVAAARIRHHDARHHCSAYVVGPPGPHQVLRAHDDGEPSGTAGAPILEVLTGRGLADVVVVVTRWFGGTLLGAGGLVRAYADSARAAVEAAGTISRARREVLRVELPHAEAGRVENALRAAGVLVVDVAYAGAVTLDLAVDPGAVERTHALLAELGGGALVAEPVGERWMDS